MVAPSPIHVTIGRRIQSRRLELGWSLAELAIKLGTKRQTLSKYEQGELRIPVNILYVATQVLGKSFLWFCGKED